MSDVVIGNIIICGRGCGCPRVCVCICVRISICICVGVGAGPVGVVVEVDCRVRNHPTAAVADNKPYLQERKEHFIVI